MGLFDEINKKFGKWIQVLDSQNDNVTIEDFDYKIVGHNNYGVRANFFLKIPGQGIKKDKLYTIKSAFMIFPNGKLKCNTFVGGWW